MVVFASGLFLAVFLTQSVSCHSRNSRQMFFVCRYFLTASKLTAILTTSPTAVGILSMP